MPIIKPNFETFDWKKSSVICYKILFPTAAQPVGLWTKSSWNVSFWVPGKSKCLWKHIKPKTDCLPFLNFHQEICFLCKQHGTYKTDFTST